MYQIINNIRKFQDLDILFNARTRVMAYPTKQEEELEPRKLFFLYFSNFQPQKFNLSSLFRRSREKQHFCHFQFFLPDILFFPFPIHSADPQSRPVVIIVLAVSSVLPSVPTFQKLSNKANFKRRQCSLLARLWVWPSGSLMTQFFFLIFCQSPVSENKNSLPKICFSARNGPTGGRHDGLDRAELYTLPVIYIVAFKKSIYITDFDLLYIFTVEWLSILWIVLIEVQFHIKKALENAQLHKRFRKINIFWKP